MKRSDAMPNMLDKSKPKSIFAASQNRQRGLEKSSPLSISLKVLLKNPILFFPKLIVAILYGFGVLWALLMGAKLLPILSEPSLISTVDISSLIVTAVLVLVISGAAFFIDIIFSGLYPILVGQALSGKKVSFGSAFGIVKKKLWLILYSGVIAWLIVGAASLLLSGVLLFFNLNALSWIISFAVAFGFIFFFYFLFPTIVFKEDSVKSSFRDTVWESFGHGKTVILY